MPEKGAVEPEKALDLLEWTADELELPGDLPVEQRPFVEVHLKLAAPMPMAASQLAQDLARSKLPLRLVKVCVDLDGASDLAREAAARATNSKPTPSALFAQAFAMAHGGLEPSEPHRAAFLEACEGIDA